jgi:hypothetical protein
MRTLFKTVQYTLMSPCVYPTAIVAFDGCALHAHSS